MAYNSGTTPTLAQLLAATFIHEQFSKDVIIHTKSNLVCSNLFNHRYEADLQKGNLVNICVISEASASDVTPGTEPSGQNLIDTTVTIEINNWKESTIEVSDLIKTEMEADFFKAGTESAGYAIVKAVDTDIGALFSTLFASAVYGSEGQTFTDDIFIGLVEELDEGDVPEPRFLIGDPSMRADMLKIDKFVRTDYVRETVPTGKIGVLYGAEVYITNNLTACSTSGNYGVYSHKDAIGVVIQSPPRSRFYDMGYKFMSKIIVDVAWGADEVRELFGIPFYTRKNA